MTPPSLQIGHIYQELLASDFCPASFNNNVLMFFMCVAGGDALVQSPRSAASVQLRYASGPVECRLHLRRDVQEKVSAPPN